jgi:chromosome segregation ATPase
MTMEEFIEHVDAPMREYLEHAANEDSELLTAWEHHKKLRDQAEEEERSDCESDPVIPEMEKNDHQWRAEMEELERDNESASPELLSPRTPASTHSEPSNWEAIKELIKASNERMERMEARTMERFEKFEARLMTSMQESNSRYHARMDNIHEELTRLKTEMEREITDKINTNYAKWVKDRAAAHARNRRTQI